MSGDKAIFDQASEVISLAILDGHCADLGLIETLATQLANVRVDVPAQLKLMLDAVRFMYVSGQAFRAIPIAQKARSLGLESGDQANTLDSLLLIGVCAAETGGLPVAMEAYADALNLAQGIGDKKRECKVWLNLGVALSYSGLFREALGCSQRVLTLIAQQPSLSSLSPSVYGNIAQCHLHLDEIRQGLSAIEKSIKSSPEPKDAHSILNRVFLENLYTCLLLEIDHHAEAIKHAELARHFASQTKSALADNVAAIALGLADVFSGQVDVGISRLVQTLESAKELKTTTREVLKALVKAYDYIEKPDEALVYLRQMLEQQSAAQKQNVLQHVKLQLEQIHPALEGESNVIRRLTAQQEVLEGRVAKQALFKAQVESMERMAVVAELRDDSTGAHSYRVGRLASLLAKENGCDDEMIFMIDFTARLHDIGKIGIPDNIVLKNGVLNASEQHAMKTHTEVGADLIQRSMLPNVQMAAEIARHHHDWWNGMGISVARGENIPLAARIVALADVYDSLTHARSYKKAWPHEDAMAAIKERRGTQFDPQLTLHFIDLMERLVAEHDDLDAYLGSAAIDSTFLQARRAIANLLVR